MTSVVVWEGGKGVGNVLEEHKRIVVFFFFFSPKRLNKTDGYARLTGDSMWIHQTHSCLFCPEGLVEKNNNEE